MQLRPRHLVAGLVLAFSAAAFGADAAPAVDPAEAEIDRQIEAARGAIYGRKGAAIQSVMRLTPEQQTAFAPVLRAYDDELMALGDRRISLIKQFARHYDAQSLDDNSAKRLFELSLDIKDAQINLLRKYFRKASTAIGVRKASEWIQVENAFMSALDTRIALAMPVFSDAMKE
jgi:hypothetical protein